MSDSDRDQIPAKNDPPARGADGPVVERCEPGRYAWCSCGLAATHPRCDGSHRGTEHKPVKVEITEAKQVAWCACGKTAKAPWCDGSHAR